MSILLIIVVASLIYTLAKYSMLRESVKTRVEVREDYILIYNQYSMKKLKLRPSCEIRAFLHGGSFYSNDKFTLNRTEGKLQIVTGGDFVSFDFSRELEEAMIALTEE